MRVIGGTLRGKKLCPIKGLSIRPTTDYLRESIFDILAGCATGAVVLDLFAGTGSLGIEALSRGAASAVFVDNHPQAMKLLDRNISACSLQDRCTVIRRNLLRGLGFLKSMSQAFDLVFIDPPYDRGFVKPTLGVLARAECAAEEAVIVIEHSLREAVSEEVAAFRRVDQRQHGKTLVSFYGCVKNQLANN